MVRARKEFRELTVSEATNYGRKTAPMLRIQGLWLQELGFNIGDLVLAKCEDGKLIIAQDASKAELIEAEKVFMEKETSKYSRARYRTRSRLASLFTTVSC